MEGLAGVHRCPACDTRLSLSYPATNAMDCSVFSCPNHDCNICCTDVDGTPLICRKDDRRFVPLEYSEDGQ